MTKAMTKLRYSHSVTTYVFIGKELPQPAPGTYDPNKWTPPTRQIFRVSIQNDGMWTVELCGGQIQSGDNAKLGRAEARMILDRYCQKWL